jgi:predicted N-acetyltransferase YhbS
MAPLIQTLTKAHDRASFSCGNETLDRYLKTQVRQDMERNLAQVFVLVAEDHKTIKGYYTLSSSSVTLTELPDSLRTKLPRYPKIPVTLLGRLAVDTRFQGQKVGALLLVDALHRAVRQTEEIASMAVIVDAIDEAATAFYRKFHFLPLPDTPRTLFIEMATIKKLFSTQ